MKEEIKIQKKERKCTKETKISREEKPPQKLSELPKIQKKINCINKKI